MPRSGYRADVAACAVTPHAGAAAAGETALFECKQVRSDLLRDSADEHDTRRRLREVVNRRLELERLLGVHLPNLRRGESLFAECDDYDFDAIRHDGLRAVRREESRLRAKLFGGTKFDRLWRYACADRLYLVVASGVLHAAEAPEGWGVLVASGSGALELVRAPVRIDAGPTARLGLLQAIALAGARRCLGDLGLTWEELEALRAQTMPA